MLDSATRPTPARRDAITNDGINVLARRALLLTAIAATLLAVACDDGGAPGGQAPEGVPEQGGPVPQRNLEIDVTDHDFGEQCLGFCTDSVRIGQTAENDDIEVTSLDIDASEQSAFELSSECAGIVEEGDGCDLRVTFRPRSRGEHHLTITVEHNGDNSPSRIDLEGIGVCPDGSEPVSDETLGLLEERVGFGNEVTGAANGCTYVVDSPDDSGSGTLREAAEVGGYWITFDQSYEIELASNISLAGNTTIDGRGHSIEIVGAGLHMSGSENRNLILTDISVAHSGKRNNDLLQITSGASDFWFNHLALADSTDEYVDISRSADDGVYGTISWTHFQRGGPQNTDEFAILIGDDGGSDTNHLIHVTLHHNWFNGTRQRNPSANGSRVHTFNNVIQWRLWGIQARNNVGDIGAQVVSENDVFDAEFTHAENPGDGARLFDDGNFLRITNPLLLNGAGIVESNPEGAFNPAEEYDYALDPVEDVMEIVTSAAGPRTGETVLSR